MLFIHILMLFFVQALEETGIHPQARTQLLKTRPCLLGEAI
jgi:hypothetical protein